MATQRPIVFALRGYGRFVGRGVQAGSCALVRFANRELIARLATPVAERRCVLIGSVAPPETQLASLVLVAHTLRRAGAASITALLPYLAYARQDVAAHGESLGLAWIGQLLRAAGVDDVVTVDVHCAQASDLLGVPLRSLSPARLLADSLTDTWRSEATFVAPDEGAIERCSATAAAAGRPGAAVHLVKRRDAGGVAHLAVRGALGTRALIVDDILDTGGTVVSCCRMLRSRGVRHIGLMVTHGLFTNGAAAAVERAGVEALWLTDSTANPRRPSGAHVVALAPLLAPLLPLVLQTPPAGDGATCRVLGASPQ